MSNSPRRKAIKRRRYARKLAAMEASLRAYDRATEEIGRAYLLAHGHGPVTTTDNGDGTFTHTVRMEP